MPDFQHGDRVTRIGSAVQGTYLRPCRRAGQEPRATVRWDAPVGAETGHNFNGTQTSVIAFDRLRRLEPPTAPDPEPE